MSDYPDFYVFGLIDGLGDIHRDVVTETGDTIFIEGYFPSDHPTDPGALFCFESDAYHLSDWAKENGMKAFKYGYKYESLGEPWKIYEEAT